MPDRGNGGPWECGTLGVPDPVSVGMADPGNGGPWECGNGGPWEWRTLGVVSRYRGIHCGSLTVYMVLANWNHATETNYTTDQSEVIPLHLCGINLLLHNVCM